MLLWSRLFGATSGDCEGITTALLLNKTSHSLALQLFDFIFSRIVWSKLIGREVAASGLGLRLT